MLISILQKVVFKQRNSSIPLKNTRGHSPTINTCSLIFMLKQQAKIFDLIYLRFFSCTFVLFLLLLIYQHFPFLWGTSFDFFQFLQFMSLCSCSSFLNFFNFFNFYDASFALNSSMSSTLFSPCQGGFYCSLFQFRKRSFFFLFKSSKPFVLW